ADVIVATKVGNRREPGKEGWSWDPSKAYIQAAVKESLRRLGTDYIDLYQLHGGTIGDPIGETIEAFEELKRDGLIRHYGISSIRPNVIREYVRRSGIVSVMNQYSMLDRRAEEEVLPLLAEHEIGLIARGPL
ncbi:aldo/keto reductase, partial [Paenibacillus sepulcri]|nr:aldo/keto reductase [Paenibacillus sepulcri]